MSKITKVFLDLDDCLCDFTMYALQFVGCPVTARGFEAYNPDWNFDIIQAANRLHKTKKFTPRFFWNSIPQSVWANASRSVEFHDILEFAINLVGREQVCILTSPTLDPACAAGKVEWIQRNMPADMQRQYFIGPRKWFCAGPDSLLIDDSDANIELFSMHGGTGILLPRPWNKNHNQRPEYLQHKFLKIERENGDQTGKRSTYQKATGRRRTQCTRNC